MRILRRKKVGNLWKKILLASMIFYDLTLHIVEILDIVHIHPLYPMFPLLGEISYDLFWTIYWLLAFMISLSLFFKRKKKNG